MVIQLIKLDIDKKENKKQTRRINIVLSLLGLKMIKVNRKETARGYHYIITLEHPRELTNLEICLIQSLMGSDYKRECYNFIRIADGRYGDYNRDWNRLFQSKYLYKNDTLKKVSEEK